MNDPRKSKELTQPCHIEVRFFESGLAELTNITHEYRQAFRTAHELANFMVGYQRAGDIVVFVRTY